MMFKADLISLLCRIKAEGDEILLMGDFNENVYTGLLAVLLMADNLRMHQLCHRTTRELLPPTHAQGSMPINAVYGTSGLTSMATALLPS